MKNFAIIFLLAITIFGIGYFLDMNSVPVVTEVTVKEPDIINLDLPDFHFKTLDDKELAIKDFRGKIVLLNFWASWCGPCLEEFPYILKILKNNPDKIILVAISNDESKSDIQKFMSRFKEESKEINSGIVIGFDPNKDISSSIFSVMKLPETFVISPEGKIIKKIVGSTQWTDGELAPFFKKHFNILI